MLAANALHEQRLAAGFNQEALDEVARKGLGNGFFEEDEDDVASVVEEFYPAQTNAGEPVDQGERLIKTTNALAGKLEQKVRIQNAREQQTHAINGAHP